MSSEYSPYNRVLAKQVDSLDTGPSSLGSLFALSACKESNLALCCLSILFLSVLFVLFYAASRLDFITIRHSLPRV